MSRIAPLRDTAALATGYHLCFHKNHTMPTTKPGPDITQPRQKAGVVAYREANGGEREILLITARQHPDSWIFPVGTVDPGETLEQAAARECAEESGYTVVVDALLATIELPGDTGLQTFSFFLAQVTGQCADYETDRQRCWVPLSNLEAAIAPVFASVAQAAVQAFKGFPEAV